MRGKVIQYYNDFDEELRLKNDSVHMIEFSTTMTYFDKIFSQGSRILDTCAGTGVYSFHLAEQGHKVVAGDIFSGNVEVMKKNRAIALF